MEIPHKRGSIEHCDLLTTLAKAQNLNWLVHLNALVFANSVMPGSTMGLQPYYLILRHKAKTPCDNWLQLAQYNWDQSVSRKFGYKNIMS